MISVIGIMVFWICAIVLALMYGAEYRKNKDLQQENTDLIERNLELDKLNRILAKDALQDISIINSLRSKLKGAKELLVIQDKLIKK
jgi:hypothetical protein